VAIRSAAASHTAFRPRRQTTELLPRGGWKALHAYGRWSATPGESPPCSAHTQVDATGLYCFTAGTQQHYGLGRAPTCRRLRAAKMPRRYPLPPRQLADQQPLVDTAALEAAVMAG